LRPRTRTRFSVAALWLSNGIVQLFVISTLFSEDAFTLMLKLSTSMSLIPYLLVAGYGLLIAWRGETYNMRAKERNRGRRSSCRVFPAKAGIFSGYRHRPSPV